jgi:hypothetical protein
LEEFGLDVLVGPNFEEFGLEGTGLEEPVLTDGR